MKLGEDVFVYGSKGVGEEEEGWLGVGLAARETLVAIKNLEEKGLV